MMRGTYRLGIVMLLLAGLAATSVLLASPAQAKRKKAAPTPTPTPVPTPIPTPAPVVKEWNFDQDKPNEVAQGWAAVEGDWQVLPDPSAPSQTNAFGLPAGREIKSLMSGLEYSAIAMVSDPTEYSDFTLQTSFKAKKGWFDCSGGLIFRYADPKNYYLLSAGCPSDYFALYRISGGKPDVIKQTVVPVDQGVWYQLKVVADGEHMSCYSGEKMVFDATDNKIKKGRIGLWAHDDSQALFDNFKLTLPAVSGAASGGQSEVPTGATPSEAAPPAGASGGAPPPMPGAPPPVPH